MLRIMKKRGEEMKKLLMISSMILTMLSMLLIGCQEALVPPQALLVPERANAIAKVKIAEILNDEDTAALYAYYAAEVEDPYTPRTLEEALDKIKEETGVDLRYFDEAMLFADISTLENAIPYWGVIVTCNVPAKHLFEISKLFGGEELPRQEYNGYEIYVIDSELGFTFLSSELIVIGPLSPVKDVIDTRLGSNRPISGTIYDLYEGLGDPLVKLAFNIPPELKREIPETFEESGFSVNLLPLRDIATVSCVLDKRGEIITAKAELHFMNTLSAETTRELIEDFMTLSKYLWPSPEIKDLLQKVQVTNYDSQVSVDFDATLTEIKDLIGALERENLL